MIFWRIIIVLCILSFSVGTQAKKPTKSHLRHHKPETYTIYGKQNLVTEINRIVQSLDSRATIGIYVKSMKGGDTLYTKNEQALLKPASTAKILTAEAALLYLGPEYKFQTTLLTDGLVSKDNDGIINGNMYLVHSGDPSLTYYDLVDMMVMLRSQQIKEIKGNVYIDNTAYDEVNIGSGWKENDLSRCFAAPISASIINRNCLSFQVSPANKLGQLASIIQSPRYFYGQIQNSVVTKMRGKKPCYVQTNTEKSVISVDGCIPKGRLAIGVSTVISDITEYNRVLLQTLFKRFGIHITGQIGSGQASHRLSSIAEHHSKPLHVLINEMLKKSDNVIAGSLLKKMGEFYTQSPGSWENGSEAIKQILAKKAYVNPAGMVIKDGSGLSSENRVKPSQMMQVLDFAYHHYGTNYEFISALPIAGIDGTLKDRLRNVTRKVRAKTGYISGVAALAGYAVSQDKEPIAFVIMVNGQNGNVWKYREAEDKIVTVLTRYSRGR